MNIHEYPPSPELNNTANTTLHVQIRDSHILFPLIQYVFILGAAVCKQRMTLLSNKTTERGISCHKCREACEHLKKYLQSFQMLHRNEIYSYFQNGFKSRVVYLYLAKKTSF